MDKRTIKYMLLFIFIFTFSIICLSNAILASKPIMKIEYNNDWIGFYGSIAGGLIGGMATLIGIMLTLEYNRRKDNEDRRLQVLPHMKFKQKSGSTSPYIEFGYYCNEYGGIQNIVTINLSIENVGLGTALGLKFLEFGNFGIPCDSPVLILKPEERVRLRIEIETGNFISEGREYLKISYNNLLKDEYIQYLSFEKEFNEDNLIEKLTLKSVSPLELKV